MKSLMERAGLLERAGDWLGADRVYAEVFEEATRSESLDILTESMRRMATVRLRQGLGEEATELADLSLEIALRCDLSQAAARAQNVLGVITHSAGRLEQAEAIYQEALERAQGAGDAETVGIICQNLGVIANVRGDHRRARVLYLETIASFVRSGNRSAAITAYNNLGMVCTDLQEWMEAQVYFGRGIEIAQQVGDTTMLAKLHLNRAEPLIRVGEFASARESLDAAESLAGPVAEKTDLADVKRFRASIARLQLDLDQAEHLIQDALAIASSADLDLEYAEALEEQSRIRLAEGRPGAARILLREALSRFQAIGARQDAERVQEELESVRGEAASDRSDGTPGAGALPASEG
jgi:tetratricopeptide (TPR) repeat protein